MYTISKWNETNQQKINERQSRQYTHRTNTASYLKNCFPSHKILSFGKKWNKITGNNKTKGYEATFNWQSQNALFKRAICMCVHTYVPVLSIMWVHTQVSSEHAPIHLNVLRMHTTSTLFWAWENVTWIIIKC